MTGVFDAIKENDKAGQGSSAEALNFAIRLTGYEDNTYFLGVRLDTREEVKVSLRPVKEKEGSSYSRPDVAAFQNKKEKVYSVINEAAIQFDQAYLQEDGTYSARWANPITKNKRYAKPYCGYTSVEFNTNGAEQYLTIRVLKVEQARLVTTPEELEAAVYEALTPAYEYAKPFCVVQMTAMDADGNKIDSFGRPVSPKFVEHKPEDMDFSEYLAASPEESLELFREKNKEIYNYLNRPDVKVVIIPGGKFSAGAETQNKILRQDQTMMEAFKSSYKIDKAGSELRENHGYALTNMGFKQSENTGRIFLSFLKPNAYNSEAYKLGDIPVNV